MLHRRLPRMVLSLAVGVPLLAAIPGGNMILAILGISFLIFIHEWGHFYACKLTGTRTETFSIGFGPRLFGWEKSADGARRFTVGRRRLDPADHAMDFRVAAIPLGGYVKMAGEIPGEGTGGPGGEPAPDEFPAKSAWARTFIVSAGVIMNFITAIVFYFIAIQGHKAYDAPLAGSVRVGDGAWFAGIEPGDRVLSINGNETPTFTDVRMEVAFADADEDNEVVVERDGKRMKLALRPIYDEELGVLLVGIGRASGLELGAGDAEGERFAIGALEDVRVAGVPARGGQEAYRRILQALDAGIRPVRIERADGTAFDFDAREGAAGQEGEQDAPLDPPGPKVGLVPYQPARVKAVRGAAAEVLAPDDHIRSVRTAEGEIPLHAARDWRRLPFGAPVQALVLERAGTERTVEVDLPDAASIAVFVGDVVLVDEPDNRVTPTEAGLASPHGRDFWRYPSAPALEAGIQPGERITRIGDKVIETFTQIPEALASAEAGKPLEFRLADAEGVERTVSLSPVAPERVGRLDITVVEYKERWEAGGVGAALGMGFARTLRETKGVFRTIGALFTGNISFDKNIAGPITLVTASERFAEDHILRLIWFLGYVSVMLAVLNILPIPVLDGGHLMFILLEKIKGKPLEEGTIYNLQKVGFLLLLVLMFFAFKNDITRIIDGQ